MDRKWVWLLCLMILAGGISGCAAIQGDLVKLQTDIQAQKASLVPKLQEGIVYAQQAGDVEWATCQQAILDIAQSPAGSVPDISNFFVNVEVIHQGSQAIQGGIQQSALVQKINQGCAAWYVREKAEIMAIAAKIAVLVK